MNNELPNYEKMKRYQISVIRTGICKQFAEPTALESCVSRNEHFFTLIKIRAEMNYVEQAD